MQVLHYMQVLHSLQVVHYLHVLHSRDTHVLRHSCLAALMSCVVCLAVWQVGECASAV